jgi:membrane-bound lytic murein transglycosylase B
MRPFAATPRSYPLAPRTVLTQVDQPRAQAQPPPPPIVQLPPHITVQASTIPRRVLAAYVNAAQLTASTDPQCKLDWQTLAGIGFIESDNARSGGSASPNWDGVASPPIFGPLLDGKHGTARVPDTDRAVIDGNTTWVRAIGPMQIMPATWAIYAADGNGDGIRNPQDIDDASLAAAHYLCAASIGLNRPRNLIRALYSYNHSYRYVESVLTAIASYLQINPAKLGINGLPTHGRQLPPFEIVLPGAPSTSSPTPPATPPPTPMHTWSPAPNPSPSLPIVPHR